MASAVRFKFRAELNYSNLQFDGHYISVGELKRLIAEKKGLGFDAANELQLIDATSKREYDDDGEQVVKNSSLIVKRVAAAARPKTIVGSSTSALAAAGAPPGGYPPPPGGAAADAHLRASVAQQQQPVEDEFGEDPLSRAALQQDEQQMQAFLANAAKGVSLEAQLALQTAGGRGGRGRGRGFPGGGRGGGRMAGRECVRCGQLGHYAAECPTQGDPAYDKRYKVPAGIPQSKIQRNADGSLYLPDGQLGELAPNTHAFQKLALLMGKAPGESGTPPPDAGVEAAQQQHEQGGAAHEAPQQQPKQELKEEPAAPSAALGHQQQPEAQAARGPQLFDDLDEHRAAPQAAQPVKIALGMDDGGAAAKGSPSPAPSSRLAMPSSRDGDGIPESLRGVGCTERELMAALPLLQHHIPGDMAMADIFRAFGSGRPLSRREFEALQSRSGRVAAGGGDGERRRGGADDTAPARSNGGGGGGGAGGTRSRRSRSRSPVAERRRTRSRSRSRSLRSRSPRAKRVRSGTTRQEEGSPSVHRKERRSRSRSPARHGSRAAAPRHRSDDGRRREDVVRADRHRNGASEKQREASSKVCARTGRGRAVGPHRLHPAGMTNTPRPASLQVIYLCRCLEHCTALCLCAEHPHRLHLLCS